MILAYAYMLQIGYVGELGHIPPLVLALGSVLRTGISPSREYTPQIKGVDLFTNKDRSQRKDVFNSSNEVNIQLEIKSGLSSQEMVGDVHSVRNIHQSQKRFPLLTVYAKKLT